MEQRALWRALDDASERLLRASEDMALSELHGLRTELEALARQALQTSAAQSARTSAVTGKTSATTENPIAATGISIAATGISIAATGKTGTTLAKPAGDSRPTDADGLEGLLPVVPLGADFAPAGRSMRDDGVDYSLIVSL